MKPEINTPAIDNIMSRTSVREFNANRSVPQAFIDTLLHAAMSAPTAMNRRPWHFIVVRTRAVLDELAAALPYCKMAAHAQLAIVCCGNKDNFLPHEDSILWEQDLSAASENILLASHALGLGAVWTCVFPHKDRMDACARILGLGASLIPFNIIPIGYPAHDQAPLNKWNAENVSYL
ncbi:MAG: nitroreductase family protein [Muribaculaceae bacterium]|nr:nitroreductase family protein [Muribaculaceae bacterium]MDE6575337.1 nitroreductase family protein [Muribaculaceae bacterium]